MYRVKAKNKDTGQTVLVWESYSKDDKAFLLYSDIELENKLDMEKYEVIKEPSNGLAFNMFGIECGKGWIPLIKPIIEYIDNYNSNKEEEEQICIMQIKEKWSTLQIYVSFGTDELFDMINKAEEESAHVCEFCGSKKNIGTTQGYYMTTCHTCVKNMAIENGHPYQWHCHDDDNVYWIHSDKDDELISSISEYKKMP